MKYESILLVRLFNPELHVATGENDTLNTVLNDLFVYLLNGTAGHIVNPGQQPTGNYRDDSHHQGHIKQIRFYLFHFAIFPKRFGLHQLLISGVTPFMIRMANDIPSGYEPKYLINTVKKPIPIPYHTIPLVVIGDVT
ncbi:MAG: hypothetical protein BWY95_02185 [Bacteroidetes bacterium ADurb.BinA104]|nr:MAG: hypothetical protein BWY95_02185 [Bacteroidetes bacterium ADurb.BinA104]